MSERNGGIDWVRFNFERWRESLRVADLSLQERGLYLELLLLQASGGAFHYDPPRLARALRCGAAEVEAGWPTLVDAGLFKEEGGKWWNPVMAEEVRRAQSSWFGCGGMPKAKSRAKVANPINADFAKWWEDEWLHARGTRWAWDGKQRSSVDRARGKAGDDVHEMKRRALNMLHSEDHWTAENSSPAMLNSRWNQLAVIAEPGRRRSVLDGQQIGSQNGQRRSSEPLPVARGDLPYRPLLEGGT